MQEFAGKNTTQCMLLRDIGFRMGHTLCGNNCLLEFNL